MRPGQFAGSPLPKDSAGGGGQYTIVFTIEDALATVVFADTRTVTVPPGGSHVETFTWIQGPYGMYTVKILDPVTGATVASGAIYVP